MSALLIYPLIEGVGTVASGFAAELGFGASASTAIGTSAQTAVATKIGTYVDQKAKDIIGKENVDKFNNAVNHTEYLFNNYNAVVNNESQYILDQANKNRLNLPASNIFDPPTITVPTISQIKLTNIFGNVGDVVSDNFPISNIVPDGSSNSVSNIEQTPQQATDQVQTTDQTQNYDTTTDVPISKINVTSISSYVVEYANSAALGVPIQDIEKDVISRNPGMIIVAKSLSDFYANKLPDTEIYKSIASVYNGRNLTLANCVEKMDQLGKEFDLIDEVGNTVQLRPTKGFTMPTIYGNFVGPYSKNADLPVSLLDLYCAFHDYDYTVYGFFDTVGDYKLLSRISQNFDRFIPEEKGPAKTALLWFSTLGTSAGALIGSLPKNIHRVPSTEMPQDDIYYVLDPTKSLTTPINQYAAERTQFYADLEREFESKTITSSLFASSGGNRLLAQEFGNIFVEIV